MFTIETASAKQVLRNYTFSISQVNEFCKLLAEALPDKNDPLLFVFEFFTLAKAIDKAPTHFIDIKGKQFRCSFAGCDLSSIMMMALPGIAEKSFSKEFATEVIKELNSLTE